MKTKFGLAALDAIQKNYKIILDRLIKGYEKITGKQPEGVDLTMIKREAYRKAEDSAKVVDMEGKTLDPSKPIIGGKQETRSLEELLEEEKRLTKKESKELMDDFGVQMEDPTKPNYVDPESEEGMDVYNKYMRKKYDEEKFGEGIKGIRPFGDNIRDAYREAGRSREDASEMIKALKSPGAKKSYEIMEEALGVRLYGNETFEELMKIKETGVHPRGEPPIKKADGGRINFMLGGPTNIIGAGLGGLEGLTPMEGVGALGAPTGLMAGDVQRPTSGYETKEGREQRDRAIQDIFDELPKDMQDMIRDQQMKDIEGQTAGIGLVSALKGLGVLGDYIINQGRTKIYNKVIDTAKKSYEQKQLKEAAERAAAARVAAMAANNRALGTGGYQSDFAQDSDFMGGGGTAAEMGSFADGGIATMFVERR